MRLMSEQEEPARRYSQIVANSSGVASPKAAGGQMAADRERIADARISSAPSVPATDGRKRRYLPRPAHAPGLFCDRPLSQAVG
jgi:hypothetical protein